MKKGNNQPKIPTSMIPNLGGAQQQQMFDLSEATMKICNGCKSEFFDKVFRMGVISQFASKNLLKKDIPVEFTAHLCRDCGLEFGKEKVKL